MTFKKIFLISVLTVLIIGIYQLPAQWTWQQVTQQINLDPRLVVDDIQGTVWRGQADIDYNRYQVGQLDWDFNASSLASLAIGGQWVLTASTHELTGLASAGMKRLAVNEVNGYLDNQLLNVVSRTYGIDLPGRLGMDSIQLEFDLTQPVEALPYIELADGRINWTGGSVIYTVGRLRQRLQLPALTAQLSERDGGLLLAIEAINSPGVLATVLLRQDGFSVIQLRARLAELANFAYASGLNPDEVLLEIKEKLF